MTANRARGRALAASSNKALRNVVLPSYRHPAGQRPPMLSAKSRRAIVAGARPRRARSAGFRVGRDPMSGVGIGAVDAGVASTVPFYYDIWYSSGMATTRDRENQIFSILGIKRRHGQTAAPDLSVSFVVRSGLPLSSFEAVVSHARVPSGELSAVVAIPPRTLQRRAKRKDPQLDREESDRLARVARLYAFASEVLGSDDAARTWMLTKNRSLDNERPFDLLDTEGDAREVEDALGRIQYGVIA
jgi:putative toxin-antitoxin system antitoxin component (TIGR02293 family)